MKCFYHGDLDGRCAAFWVHLNVGLHNPEHDNTYIEINYNEKFPLETIKLGEQIWIVDFSVAPEEMTKLLEVTTDITWIDHHKTAIEKYKDFPTNIRGIRQDGVAGCELTFCYIHLMTERGDGPIKPFDFKMLSNVPLATRFIGDWDVWKFAFGDATRNFQVGMLMREHGPEAGIWGELLKAEARWEEPVKTIIEEGAIALQYRDQKAKEYLKSFGHIVQFEGYSCIAVNLGLCNSEYFKSVTDDYDIMLPFVFDGKGHWVVSMYSTKTDVSGIAKKYGGGGHKGAAGFTCYKLPWEEEG